MPLGVVTTVTALFGGSAAGQPTQPAPAPTAAAATGTPVTAPATINEFSAPPAEPAPAAAAPEASPAPAAAAPEETGAPASAASAPAEASEPTQTLLDIVSEANAAEAEAETDAPKSGWSSAFVAPAASGTSAPSGTTLATPVADDDAAARAHAIRAQAEERESDLIANLSAARNKAVAAVYESGADALRATDSGAAATLNRAA